MSNDPRHVIHSDGTQTWRLNGRFHRLDGPAIIGADGSQEWWVNGLRHREDGPAVIHDTGSKSWWFEGERHRLDGPAMIWIDGTEHWWIRNQLITERVLELMAQGILGSDWTKWTDEDRIMMLLHLEMKNDPRHVIHPDGSQDWRVGHMLHRLDGPARIFRNGTQQWCVDGELHRLDGPAIIGANGSLEWWVEGQRHRLDGPAMIRADGTEHWWIRDQRITERVLELMAQGKLGSDWTKWTDEDRVMMQLCFGDSTDR